MEIFHIRIKQELKSQGKQQKDLCEFLNVKKSTLSQWLSGKTEPPLNVIPQIAVFLNVSTDYLFGLVD